MIKRVALLVVALLIAGSVVAGCGDDGDQDSRGAATATQSTPNEAGSATDEASGGSGGRAAGADSSEPADEGDDSSSDDDASAQSGSAPAAEPLSVDQTSKACEENAESAERLPKKAREQFEEICDKAAAGDEEGLRESVRDICRQMVESSLPEDSPQRDEALANCDRATE